MSPHLAIYEKQVGLCPGFFISHVLPAPTGRDQLLTDVERPEIKGHNAYGRPKLTISLPPVYRSLTESLELDSLVSSTSDPSSTSSTQCTPH